MFTSRMMGGPTVRGALTALTATVLLLVSLAMPVTAQTASRIPFAGYFYGCASTDGTVWVSGDVLHIRDFSNHNLWVTGNPLLDGYEDNGGLGNINLSTGFGVGHPRSTLRPDAVNGTWEMQITVDITPTGLTGRGTGRGTGDLQGMSLEFESPGSVALSPGENPCSDLPFAAIVQGEILVSASAD